VSSRNLPRRGLSDGLMTAAVEVSSHYLPCRGLSDGLMTAVIGVLVVTCHIGVFVTEL
jgi:hypothetical protein